MYSYPIKLEFPMISIGRQVDVRNGDGKFIMRATDPFFSFKDSMNVTNGNGTSVYQINGDTSFRFMFQFASMSTVWNIQTPDGKPVASVRKYPSSANRSQWIFRRSEYLPDVLLRRRFLLSYAYLQSGNMRPSDSDPSVLQRQLMT